MTPFAACTTGTEVIAALACATFLCRTRTNSTGVRPGVPFFGIAGLAVAILTAATSWYISRRLDTWWSTGHIILPALILQIVGISWLRRCILESIGVVSLSASPAIRRQPANDPDGLTRPDRRHGGNWAVTDIGAGILVFAVFSNESWSTAISHIAVALVVSTAIAFVTPSRKIPRLDLSLCAVSAIALSSLATYRISEGLGMTWQTSEFVLPVTVALWLILSWWILETFRGDRLERSFHANGANRWAPSSLGRRTSMFIRHIFVACETVGWTLLMGTALHFNWAALTGMQTWRIGLLLVVGFAAILLHSVLAEARFPADG